MNSPEGRNKGKGRGKNRLFTQDGAYNAAFGGGVPSTGYHPYGGGKGVNQLVDIMTQDVMQRQWDSWEKSQTERKAKVGVAQDLAVGIDAPAWMLAMAMATRVRSK